MKLKISGDAAHGWNTFSRWYWQRFCWLVQRCWHWFGSFAIVAVLHGKKIQKFSLICILCWWLPVSSLYLDFVSYLFLKCVYVFDGSALFTVKSHFIRHYYFFLFFSISISICSDSVVPFVQMFETYLCKIGAHIVPCVSHSMHRSWFFGRLGFT